MLGDHLLAWGIVVPELLPVLLQICPQIQARLEWSYGLAHIVDILRGSQAQKITAAQRALSTHGIGADKSKQHWMSIGKELIQQGWLNQSVGKFPVVELNGRSWEVLRGKAQVMLTTFEETKPVKKAGKPSQSPAFESGSDDQARFEKLRTMRTKLAKASNVPAYLVLSDRSLKELCTALPATLADLESVHGFGKVKIEKFGQAFLDALHQMTV